VQINALAMSMARPTRGDHRGGWVTPKAHDQMAGTRLVATRPTTEAPRIGYRAKKSAR
jgi:hypothetical protein